MANLLKMDKCSKRKNRAADQTALQETAGHNQKYFGQLVSAWLVSSTSQFAYLISA